MRRGEEKRGYNIIEILFKQVRQYTITHLWSNSELIFVTSFPNLAIKILSALFELIRFEDQLGDSSFLFSTAAK